jgi:hypothetical protein
MDGSVLGSYSDGDWLVKHSRHWVQTRIEPLRQALVGRKSTAGALISRWPALHLNMPKWDYGAQLPEPGSVEWTARHSMGSFRHGRHRPWLFSLGSSLDLSATSEGGTSVTAAAPGGQEARKHLPARDRRMHVTETRGAERRERSGPVGDSYQ